jgi:hypothetical protein
LDNRHSKKTGEKSQFFEIKKGQAKKLQSLNIAELIIKSLIQGVI